MQPARRCLPALLFFLAASLAAQAPIPAKDAAPHWPGNEELRHFKAISAPLLSPDGSLALFSITESTADGAKSHLWIAPVSGGAKARQLTFSPTEDKRGERSAAWAPDGSALYFLAHRSEHTQLYRLDMRGGEAQVLDIKVRPSVDESKEKDAVPPPPETKDAAKDAPKDAAKEPDPLPIDISGYALAPSGRTLAFWARDPETPGEKAQKDAKADASWVDHERHLTRLYLVSLDASGLPEGAVRPAAVAPEVQTALWSPDSGRLLVITQGPNSAGDLGPSGAAWLLDPAAPEKPEKLAAIPATVGRGASWSADGKTVYFAGQTPEDALPATKSCSAST